MPWLHSHRLLRTVSSSYALGRGRWHAAGQPRQLRKGRGCGGGRYSRVSGLVGMTSKPADCGRFLPRPAGVYNPNTLLFAGLSVGTWRGPEKRLHPATSACPAAEGAVIRHVADGATCATLTTRWVKPTVTPETRESRRVLSPSVPGARTETRGRCQTARSHRAASRRSRGSARRCRGTCDGSR